jgi:anaerobic dimethyl sulfoxide reductase subunit B (iron-sulfur subunit)
MRKCDYCLDRRIDDKLPICVEACPTRAIDADFFDDLKAKYGNIQQAEGFKYSERVKPSVIFKPKQA